MILRRRYSTKATERGAFNPVDDAEHRSRAGRRASSCLSPLAYFARSELASGPARREAQGTPRSGASSPGVFSFGYFSLDKQRKVPRPRGRDPAINAFFVPVGDAYNSWIPDLRCATSGMTAHLIIASVMNNVATQHLLHGAHSAPYEKLCALRGYSLFTELAPAPQSAPPPAPA